MGTKKGQDRLFRSIFINKDRLLELYNAIDGTNYSDPSAITIINTEYDSPFYYSNLRARNDIEFIIGNSFVCIEHQLSVDPITPLRMFMYLGRLCEEMLEGSLKEKYWKDALEIAANSRFFVLYCGEDDHPAEGILKITDLFADKGAKSGLILDVVVLNINKGCNPELEEKSKSLAAYVNFIARERKHLVPVSVGEINGCPDDKILKDYLAENSQEVIDLPPIP